MKPDNNYQAALQMKTLTYAYYAACIEQSDEHGILSIDPDKLTHWFARANRKAGRHIEKLVIDGWLEHLSGMGTTFRVVSFDEHEDGRKQKNIRNGDRWGVWKLNARNLTLECDTPDAFGYEIDLEEINDGAEILDWMFHLADKRWMTPQMVHDLLEAFEDIFHARATFCQRNRGSRIDATAFLKWRLGKRPTKPEPLRH